MSEAVTRKAAFIGRTAKRACWLGLSALALSSCGDNADENNDGQVSRDERAAEMQHDAFIAMMPGQWNTTFTFNEIDVPTLGKSQKQQIMKEMANGASSSSCLSAEEAKNPGADFFGGNGAEKCIYKKFDVSGQNVKMTLSCTMDGMGNVDMEMKGVIGDDQFNFDADLAMRLPVVGKVKLKGTAVGRHAGACTAAG